MSKSFKPMLASRCEDVATLQFPVLVSPKLDGVRAIVMDGQLLSRSLKPIPNYELALHFESKDLDGLDGELITGRPTDKDAYLDTVSNVMSQGGDADQVHLWVFDDFEMAGTFAERYGRASQRVKELSKAGYRVCMVPHFECHSVQELQDLEGLFLRQGYEGAMVRSYSGPYKYGRSTVREGYLLKVKRFMDGDAEILGYEELMRNNNEQTKNELGHSTRSHVQAGMVPGDCLGTLNVRDCVTGVEFSIGSGFTQAQRNTFWKVRTTLIGGIVKYKYFPTGSKERPRFPTFIGFRNPTDM